MQRRFAVAALVALAVGLAAAPAIGQVTTSGIRGLVVDATGPLPGAQVLAVNVASGFQYGAVADGDGSFKLSGLVPGTYEVKVSSQTYTEQSVRVQVLLGQDAEVSFTLSPTEVFVGDVTVVGETTKLLIDTRSPVVSTNVTTQQIEALPQNNRNFLSFAALAPGVAFTDDTNAAGQEFRSGGANPKQVNVFIDGMSYKNDIIKGGAFMQDSSQGNPFPQNAVQEYQVLTQNYKAEYEKSAAAVITAITKSGGNEFHGEVFWLLPERRHGRAGRLCRGPRRRGALVRPQPVWACVRRSDRQGQAPLLPVVGAQRPRERAPRSSAARAWDEAPDDVIGDPRRLPDRHPAGAAALRSLLRQAVVAAGRLPDHGPVLPHARRG